MVAAKEKVKETGTETIYPCVIVCPNCGRKVFCETERSMTSHQNRVGCSKKENAPKTPTIIREICSKCGKEVRITSGNSWEMHYRRWCKSGETSVSGVIVGLKTDVLMQLPSTDSKPEPRPKEKKQGRQAFDEAQVSDAERDCIEYDEFSTVKKPAASKYYSAKLNAFVCPHCGLEQPFVDQNFYTHVSHCKSKKDESLENESIFELLKRLPVRIVKALDAVELKKLIVDERDQ